MTLFGNNSIDVWIDGCGPCEMTVAC